MRSAAVLFLAILGTRPLDAETIRVVTTEMRPFFYRDGGEPRGIEYDILRLFAARTDAALEIRWVPRFADVLAVLERGEADVAAAGITITTEREKRFDFSEPYFPSQVLLVEPASRTTEDPAALAGERVGALEGSVGAALVGSLRGVERVPYTDLETMFRDIADGRLRAGVAETARAILLLERYPGLRLGAALGETQHYGFATAPGSPLAPALSEHLREIKRAGIYYRILRDHLGERAVAIVRAATP